MVVIHRFRTVHAPAPQWVKSTPGREDSIVFVIRLRDGEEVHGAENDELSVNEQTGVLTVVRVDGFEEVTTHYSPSAWASVTRRVKARRPLVGANKK